MTEDVKNLAKKAQISHRRCSNVFFSLLVAVLVFIPSTLTAQFVEIPSGFPDNASGPIVWGDFDNDGDLDLLMNSYPGGMKLYLNNGDESFTQTANIFPSIADGSITCGDIDNDGDLDILFQYQPVGRVGIMINDGNGNFIDQPIQVSILSSDNISLVDYDCDGDLDVFSIENRSETTAVLYRNDGNTTFTEIYSGIVGLNYSSVDWGDYDNDGYADLLITGMIGQQRISKVYHNNGDGSFTDINAGLEGIGGGDAAWGDYDNDGDLDILFAGYALSGPVTKLYRNNGNQTFSNINTSLTGLAYGSTDWGDYDNDGDMDILLTGFNLSDPQQSLVFRNDGNGSFYNLSAAIEGVRYSSAAWGDIDSDGDLDFVLTGNAQSGYTTKVYRNDTTVANQSPSIPGNLSAQVQRGSITFSWDSAVDDNTPQSAITYNIRVGYSDNPNAIVTSMSSDNGYRLVPSAGNAGTGLNYSLYYAPPNSTLYASIQSIDTSYRASAFSAPIIVQTPNVSPPLPANCIYPLSTASVNITNGLTLRWSWASSSSGDLATGYYLFVGTGGSSNNIVDGINVGNTNYFKLTGDQLITEDTYQWMVVPFNIGGSAQNCPLWSFSTESSYFVNTGLPGSPSPGGSGSGDVNNDGFQDYLVENVLHISNNGVFEPLNYEFDITTVTANVFLDYDNDGDLDLIISGIKTHELYGDNGQVFYQDENKTLVYNNSNSIFSLQQSLDLPIRAESIEIGDYDCDGFFDLLFSGNLEYDGGYFLYRNVNGVFQNISFDVGPVHPSVGRAKFGDFDNDGDLDIIVIGTFLLQYSDGWTFMTRYFSNNNGLFEEVQIGLTFPQTGSYWGSTLHVLDYEHDGKLDYIASNTLFRNTMSMPLNTPPSIPTASHATDEGDYMTLYWNPSTDNQTNSQALSYTIKVGTSPGSDDVYPAVQEENGFLITPEFGYTHSNCFWKVHKSIFSEGNSYYWSVQAIDSGYMSSGYSLDCALPLPLPNIELLGETNINFDQTIKNEYSEWIPIRIRNSGLGLQVLNVSLESGDQNFEIGTIDDLDLGLFGSIATIMVRFTPVTIGDHNGILNIGTNATNDPMIQITLTGIGLSVPPRSPDNILLSCIDDDVVITWQPVSLDIHDDPITTDGYIVLFSEEPGIDAYYWFLGFTNNTSIMHPGVTRNRSAMFYRVLAIKHDNDPILREYYKSLKEGNLFNISNIKQANGFGENKRYEK
jgi:hypothetical protein